VLELCVCCSVLQCVAACCSALPSFAFCCSVSQCERKVRSLCGCVGVCVGLSVGVT